MLLSNLKCEACKANSPRATDADIAGYMEQLPDWTIVEQDGVRRLQRVYKFENFVDAMAFAGRVTDIAEAAQHHPLITIEWGRALVQWWTHSIRGLHLNDFILAARTDELFAG
jgi:4a-hydroxytetrahydrobiopterin dehydratase